MNIHEYAIMIGLSLSSLAVVLVLTWHGHTERLYAASALFLRLVVSFLIAMSFYKTLTVLITTRSSLDKNLVMRISFLVLLVGGYLALTELYGRWMEPDHVVLPKMIDRVGGMIFGALAGAVLVGLLLLMWSFIPFTYKIGPLPKDMPVDMGKVLINEYANLSNRMPKAGRFDRHEEIKAYYALHEAEQPGLSQGPVVGIKSAEIHSSKDSWFDRELTAGTYVTVLEDKGDSLIVRVWGTEGEIHRGWLCSEDEFYRRKKANEVPESAVGAVKGYLFDGEFDLEQGKVTLKSGQALWLPKEGDKLSTPAGELVGNPDVLYLYKGGKFVSLPVWPRKTTEGKK